MVRLSALLRELKNGTTIKQDKSGTGYKVTRIESLQQQTIDFDRLGNIVDKNKIKENDWYEAGDVALSHINSAEHVGKTAVIQENMLPLVHGMNLLRLRFNDLCQPILFQLFSRSYQYKAEIRARINMAVNQVSINQKNLGTVEFPLPSINEQSRIVARIESLFAKLDEAKEKIQEVLDGADLRRAAILHQAFTGKLTEKWRRENGVSDDSRETSNVKSICNSLKYGTAKKSVQDGDVAVLRMGNLQNGEIDWGSLVYSNDQDDIEKYSLKDGDVLFNRTNSAELVGKTSIYRGERPAIYAGYLIKLDYKRDKIIGDFFNYMLNSPKAKEYCNKVKTDGVNQSNINAKKIGAFEFDVPTILEQQEIVRLLDNLLSSEQSTVTACEEALTTIDTLKKSILARAFRGELGTNDPTESSAKELLQEILAS